MHLPRIAFLGTLPWLVGCAPPDFPGAPVFGSRETLTIPALDPIDTVLAGAPIGEGRAEEGDAALQARGARLRARAEALRQADP